MPVTPIIIIIITIFCCDQDQKVVPTKNKLFFSSTANKMNGIPLNRDLFFQMDISKPQQRYISNPDSALIKTCADFVSGLNTPDHLPQRNYLFFCGTPSPLYHKEGNLAL